MGNQCSKSETKDSRNLSQRQTQSAGSREQLMRLNLVHPPPTRHLDVRPSVTVGQLKIQICGMLNIEAGSDLPVLSAADTA